MSDEDFAKWQPSSTSAEVLSAAIELMGGNSRPGQSAMVGAVERTLEQKECLLVQAGTGTGKSLGYLIPALLYASQNKARVVISTATLALQEQIINKDAPVALKALKSILGAELRVEVLKGWSNYVCKHKLNGGYENVDLFAAGGVEFSTESNSERDTASARHRKRGVVADTKRLYAWAHETQTGDYDEAPRGINAKAWHQVSISAMECLGDTCPYADSCFPAWARERAASAQVVVTNHAMLGLLAAQRSNPVPDFDVLIIDEAHELPERTRSQASAEVSAKMVYAAAAAAKACLLPEVEALETQAAAATKAGHLPEVEALETQAAAWEKALEGIPDGRLTEVPAQIEDCVTLSLAALQRVLLRFASPDKGAANLAESETVAVAKAMLTNLCDALHTIDSAKVSDGDTVLWVSRDRTKAAKPTLHTAPLDMADKLHDNLYKGHGVVATSATLRLGKSFAPMRRALGFNFGSTPPECLDVGTPFETEKQAILYIASDLPIPGQGDHSPQLWDRLVELVNASQGAMLGLFSSREKAQRAGEVLRERTKFPILVQYEDSISSLIADMREDNSACLLGTLSLYQGVDLPGDTCRLVVMDRIPFPVPSDPIIEARCQAAKRAKRNDFMEVSVTHAALLMAQGAGRLLRTSTDRGVVAVLDSRLSSKGYSNFIKTSMPPMWETEDCNQVRSALQRLAMNAEARASE